MNRRLPPEAFERYVALGVDRSYQAVADHFGVSKVTVVRHAKEERWQERIVELEAKSRERSELRRVAVSRLPSGGAYAWRWTASRSRSSRPGP